MADAKAPAAHPKKWLIAYNSISASLWSIVLFNTVFLGALLGQPHLFDKTNVVLTLVQLCAVVEIVNSVTGVVKSPVFTTVSQVLSRLLIVLVLARPKKLWALGILWLLFAILFTYPPGLYTLYTYMIRQRKKVLGTGKVPAQKKRQ
ncbi:hypothetical protein HF325_004396 [Metschnikowia pulcherrima]|uniref:Very-long-chain (3R)-3-hydroxyacyl-CoA dehydratase n=1 Tax=Metschnikowia pulcherrima TaxID=27326 RepID=A0A8H7GQB9_9ASCO|nr:hypothetical protein HF325_004396 [Metschnikowia pulcherrima]